MTKKKKGSKPQTSSAAVTTQLTTSDISDPVSTSSDETSGTTSIETLETPSEEESKPVVDDNQIHTTNTESITNPSSTTFNDGDNFESNCKTLQSQFDAINQGLSSFSETLVSKFENSTQSITKSIENTKKVGNQVQHLKQEQLKASQQGTLLDPSVQQLVMGFMTQIDNIVEQRDKAITEKMSQMGNNLQKLSKNVKVIETLKKAEPAASESTVEASSNSTSTTEQTVPNSNVESNEEELKKKITELEKQVQEKETDFSNYKVKVTEWKEKVKVISSKDMKKIEELKKQVSGHEKTIQDLQKQIEETPKPTVTTNVEREKKLEEDLKKKDDEILQRLSEIEKLKESVMESKNLLEQTQSSLQAKNQQYDELAERLTKAENTSATVIEKKKEYQNLTVLKRLEIDTANWLFVKYISEGNPIVEWIEKSKLDEVYNSEPLSIPEKSITQEIEEKYQEKILEETKKVEAQTKLHDEKDEELKTYKVRAHAALKKKTDALNQAKVDHEKQISELNETISKKTEENEELTKSNQDLQDQVNTFLEIQEKAVKLGSELDRVTSEKDEIEEKLKSVEKLLERTRREFDEEKKTIIQDFEIERKQLESKNDELDDQFRKELRLNRERSRRILEEKEREITKLQLKISETKGQSDEAEQLKERTASLENELTLIKDENESLKNQIKDMMNSIENSATTPRKPAQSQIMDSVLSDDPSSSSMTPSSSRENLGDFSPAISSVSDLTLERDFNQLMELAHLQASRDTELIHYKESIKKLKEIVQEREHSEKSFKMLEKQMKQEIEHLQRLQKQGAPNLEYLKNILYSFLTGDDKIVKEVRIIISKIVNLYRNYSKSFHKYWTFPKTNTKRFQKSV